MKYLVDTDWAIHYLNGRADVTRHLDSLKQEGVCLSVISLAELYEGVYYSRDPKKDERGLQDFLRGIVLMGVDEHAAKIFGQQRGKLRSTGMLIGDIDLFIAATALQHELVLLTDNRRHFERINGLKLMSSA